jgi:two-component system cell cycle response regulator
VSGAPILIVEDNPVNSKLFRVVLEKAGFHVLVAKDADAALGALADFSPRLILMDVQLPQVDGFELTRRLKADARYRHIPIVALTAYVMKGDRERALEAGCEGYIAKPIDTRTFVDSVRRYLYSKPAAVTTAANTGGRLILVVDDDHTQRRLLEIHLTQLGFEVVPARDGAEAIDRILARQPDVVVSDILMPRLDGFRLVQFIRHESSLSSLPIVLMTSGAIRPSDQELARNLGANSIVARTDGFDHIVPAIRSALVQGALSTLAEGNEIIQEQRKCFVDEGLRDSRNLLESFHSGFDFVGARKHAHRWAGTGGTLGLPQVSQAAFSIERMLLETEPDLQAVLAKLAGVHDLFSVAARAERAVTVSDAVAASLSGKRFAAVGFDEVEARRLKETLQKAQAVLRIRYAVPAASERWADLYDGAILNVTEDFDTQIGTEFLTTTDKPVVAIGLSSSMVERALSRHRGEHDFLFRPWNPSELVLRCYTVIRRSSQQSTTALQETPGRR